MIKASEIKEGGHYWIKYKNHKEVAYFEPSVKVFYLNGVRDAILPNDIFIIEKVNEPTTEINTREKATDFIPVVSGLLPSVIKDFTHDLHKVCPDEIDNNKQANDLIIKSLKMLNKWVVINNR